MAASPVFIGTPKSWLARVTAANTTPDANVTTNLVVLATGAATGTRIERLNVTHAPALATTANTVGMIRVYHKVSTTYRLVKELTMAVATRTASVAGSTNEWVRSDGQPIFILASGEELVVGTQVAEPYDITAVGGDY